MKSQEACRHPRPPWCTDETYVRVKIEPVVVDGEEYCFADEDGSCSHYRHLGYCAVHKRELTMMRGLIERPEACRKLEVE